MHDGHFLLFTGSIRTVNRSTADSEKSEVDIEGNRGLRNTRWEAPVPCTLDDRRVRLLLEFRDCLWGAFLIVLFGAEVGREVHIYRCESGVESEDQHRCGEPTEGVNEQSLV
jgi:hypothetical protein